MKLENNLYQLLVQEQIEEIEGEAFLYQHLKSGAQVVMLKNQDPHKAFSITFKTPPQDDTGVCHIIEHAVCCASEKYPLRDTFMAFDKGSVNTAFNACTYKDITMFYGASLYEKDLMNMVDVYMDLVFHPLIYKKPELFKQEAWHLKLENKKGPLAYNGIVYNEMQGEYGESSTWLECEMHRALFPDSCYQYDSGGVPEAIVTLTEEAFLAFHQKHYVPNNAVIYFYGDLDQEVVLKQLDARYLSQLEKGTDVASVSKQPKFSKPVQFKKTYPVSGDEKEDEKTVLGISFVVGEVTDTELRLACQMLEHMLLKSAASPLATALIEEAGLGKALNDLGYDSGKYQPTFSIVLNDCVEGKIQVFKETIFKTLRKLAEEGLPKDLVDAAFNTVSFGLYEGDGGGEPKGILYGEDILMSLLYGGKPFGHIGFKKHLKAIEQAKNKGYFEAILQTYFLENTHYACMELAPSKASYKEQQKKQKESLQGIKAGLTKKEKEDLIALQEILEQEEEEDLAVLPQLAKADIQKAPKYLKYECIKETITYLWHEAETRGISYVHMLFDASVIPQEDIHYVGLLAHILTYLSTEGYNYDDLENAINKETGGLNCSINAYSQAVDTNAYKPYFKISAKILDEKLQAFMDLVVEITTKSLFTEKEKLFDLLKIIQHEYEKSFTSTPEYRATRRCYTYFSNAAVYEDLVSGFAFYGFITDFYNHYDKQFEEVSLKLQQVYEKLMRKEGLIISVTSEKKNKNKMEHLLSEGTAHLSSECLSQHQYTLAPTRISEGYMTSTQVQAIAKGYTMGTGKDAFNGSMYVASHLLNTDYLWNEIRLSGGAYGADLSLTRDGNVMLISYCDPNLVETIECFQEIGDYLENLQLEEKELERYIIGTLGGMDYPTTMEQKSEQVLIKYVCGITDEMLEQERREVLNTTQEQLQKIGQYFKEMPPYLCVIGSGKKLKKHKELFEHLATIHQIT